MATKNSRQPFNLVCYVNVLRALPNSLKYCFSASEGDQMVCNVIAGRFSAVPGTGWMLKKRAVA